VKGIVKEMLEVMESGENEILGDLTLKLCLSVERYSPNKRWYVDTIIKVLSLAGNFVKDESISSLIHVISGTPELQTPSVRKLFFTLRENPGL
jgi:AP-1 complex subunit gamma-1